MASAIKSLIVILFSLQKAFTLFIKASGILVPSPLASSFSGVGFFSMFSLLMQVFPKRFSYCTVISLLYVPGNAISKLHKCQGMGVLRLRSMGRRRGPDPHLPVRRLVRRSPMRSRKLYHPFTMAICSARASERQKQALTREPFGPTLSCSPFCPPGHWRRRSSVYQEDIMGIRNTRTTMLDKGTGGSRRGF
jgi:hypothetical protein